MKKVIALILISIYLFGLDFLQSAPSENFDDLAKELSNKHTVYKAEVRKLVGISRFCKMRLMVLVIKGDKTLIGLPLFDSAINRNRIKEVLHVVINNCD